MDHTLFDQVKITKLMNSTVGASGTTDLESSALDMTGYDGVLFLINWGAITSGGVQSAYLEQCDTTGGSYAHLTGSRVTVADSDDNKITALNLWRPREEFIKVGIFRATQVSTVESIVAIQYKGDHKNPITQGTTYVQGSVTLVSPAETTLSE